MCRTVCPSRTTGHSQMRVTALREACCCKGWKENGVGGALHGKVAFETGVQDGGCCFFLSLHADCPPCPHFRPAARFQGGSQRAPCPSPHWEELWAPVTDSVCVEGNVPRSAGVGPSWAAALPASGLQPCGPGRRRGMQGARCCGFWSDLVTPGTIAGLLQGVHCPLHTGSHQRSCIPDVGESCSSQSLVSCPWVCCTAGPVSLLEEPALLRCPLGLWEG